MDPSTLRYNTFQDEPSSPTFSSALPAPFASSPPPLSAISPPSNSSFLSLPIFIFTYLRSSIQKNPKGFKIGLFSLFLVLGFILSLESLFQMAPIVFVRLAESQASDTDFMITRSTRTHSFINSSEFESKCLIKNVNGCSPRWLFNASAFIKSSSSPPPTSSQHSPFPSKFHPSLSVPSLSSLLPPPPSPPSLPSNLIPSFLMAIDSQKEISIGLGRRFLKRTLSFGECYVNSALLGTEVINSKIQLFLDFSPFFQLFKDSNGHLFSKLSPILILASKTPIELSIVYSMDEPKGKYPEIFGNVVIIDYHYLNNYILQLIWNTIRFQASLGNIAASLILLNKPFQKELNQTILSFSYEDHALSENVVIDNKLNFYRDKTIMHSSIVATSNSLAYDEDLQFTSLLEPAMSQLFLLQAFLNSVVLSTIVFLLLLSLLLVSSLTSLDLHQKNREYAIFRALGLTSSSLLSLFASQTLSFSLPGTFLGVLFSQLIITTLKLFLEDFCLIDLGALQFSLSAVMLALILGFLVPLVGSIVGKRETLQKSIREALEGTKGPEVRVLVAKLEQLGVGVGGIGSGILLVLMGVVSYYFIPRAVLMMDLGQLVEVLDFILIGMICGITILVSLGRGLLESGIKAIVMFVCWRDRGLKGLVTNGMERHNERNTKTALMFSLSVAFMIFAGSATILLKDIVHQTFQKNYGADMTAEVGQKNIIGLDEWAIRDYIKQFEKVYPDSIKSYSFASFPLMKILPEIEVNFENIAGFPSNTLPIVGLDQDFLNSSLRQHYLPDEVRSDDPIFELSSNIKKFQLEKDKLQLNSNRIIRDEDALERKKNNSLTNNMLEEEREIIKVIVPSALKTRMSLDLDTPVLFLVNGKKYLGKIIAFLDNLPGFAKQFSKFEKTNPKPVLIIATHQMKFLVQEGLKLLNKKPQEYMKKYPKNLTYGIPKDKVYIKYNYMLNESQRAVLSNGLRGKLNDLKSQVYDTIHSTELLDKSLVFLDAFFYVVACIAAVLAFFIVLVSFIHNVRESRQEIGILRSIGVNQATMTRIYMYQATFLILSSSLLGVFMGTSISNTIVLQFLGFFELPFKFTFPLGAFMFVCGIGIVTALMSAWLAVRETERESIIDLNRGK